MRECGTRILTLKVPSQFQFVETICSIGFYPLSFAILKRSSQPLRAGRGDKLRLACAAGR
jgi:hypothetical protein